jgi:hypothetical protein
MDFLLDTIAHFFLKRRSTAEKGRREVTKKETVAAFQSRPHF